MRRFRLIALCFIILTLFLLGSCTERDRLNTPTGVEVEYETLTLKWNTVPDAVIYSVRIEADGLPTEEVTVSKNYYSLFGLAEGSYKLSVKAVANSNKVSDSKYSNRLDFDRDAETGLEFKLINDAKAYEVIGKGTATGVLQIPAFYRKLPVVSIGENAFFNQSDITEVILPDSITKIGNFAFSNCSYLTRVNIPAALGSLGESAFSGCRALSGSLMLPSSLHTVSKGAFAYCSSLNEISFAEGIEAIEDSAFSDCSSLESLVLPNSLKTIGPFAFAACADVTSVVFGDSLESLGEFAFSKAMSISSVDLPESLKSIGKGVFYHCTSLSSVRLGDGIEQIGDAAFLDTPIYQNSPTNEVYVGKWFIGIKDITSLSIQIKDGTLGIANNALWANQYIQSIELPNSVQRIGESAFAGSSLVSIVIGSGVKYIADCAFLTCERLSTVFLGSFDYGVSGGISESSLETIGRYAFMNCVLLESIEIPDTVKEIGSYAFRNTHIYNSALTGIVYADGWVVDYNNNMVEDVSVFAGTVGISNYAFYNCTTLKNIIIPGSVKLIGKGAFYGCASLERVTLPDTLRRIEDYTFYCCTNLSLSRVSFPPMLKEIGKSAFYKCAIGENDLADTDSDTLTLPALVTYIGDYAFYGCGFRRADSLGGAAETCGIDILLIGGRVEYIGRCAFYGFASLRSVVIEEALMIGEKAFFECPSLEDVTVRASITNIGEGAFYKCGALKSVSMPGTLAKIGEYAFFACESLEQLSLGNGLREIDPYAFADCIALKSVNLSSLEKIGEQAFSGCDSLESVIIGSGVKNIGENAFYSSDGLAIYVEDGVDTSQWSEYWNASFAPVVWGCRLSEDDEYVISVITAEGFVSNAFEGVEITAPIKHGYTFLGWSSVLNATECEYTTNEILTLDGGIRLYSVWRPE